MVRKLLGQEQIDSSLPDVSRNRILLSGSGGSPRAGDDTLYRWGFSGFLFPALNNSFYLLSVSRFEVYSVFPLLSLLFLCVSPCVPVSVQLEARGQSQVLFLGHSPPWFFETGSLIDLGLSR